MIFDVEKMFGLRQKPLSTLYTPDYIGPQLGYNIAWFAERFPNTYAMLHGSTGSPDYGLGWTDSEILESTYAWACFQEASLMAQGSVWPDASLRNVLSRGSVKYPAGRWFLNRELRCSLGLHSGEGSSNDNYSNGATNLFRDDTYWKSLYGAPQGTVKCLLTTWAYPGESAATQALYPYLAPISYGQSWSHGFILENMRLYGTNNSFNDPSYQECGIMLTSPGEVSEIRNCYFEHFNDFGILIDGTPAPASLTMNSCFYNGVAQVGIRGCALSNIRIIEQSGDYNPYMVYVFRQGFEGPNGVASYWPSQYNGNPGGTITMISPKIEAFCCSTKPGYGACVPATSDGRGQMLARLTGRFTFNVLGGTLYGHLGKVNTAIKVDDDFYSPYCGNGSSGIPLNNSSIRMLGVYNKRFKWWAHIGGKPTGGNRKFEAYDNATDPTWDNDQNYTDFYWNNLSGTVSNPLDSANSITTLTGVYDGPQPFINDTLGNTWNELAAPTSGYNTVTGANYP